MGNVVTLLTQLEPLVRNAGPIIQVVNELIERYRAQPQGPANVPNFENENADQLREQARRVMAIDTVGKYNFAFVGFSGVGKSLLINALMDLDDSDPSAAQVSAGVEGTMEVKHYQHPRMEHIVFWDTPGCGTILHPARTYFRDKMLYAFDCLIIVGEERFSEADITIAETAQQYGIPFVFVRSKMDQVMKNECRNKKRETNIQILKEELKLRIISNIMTDLARTSIRLENRQVYFTSSLCFRNQNNEYLMDELDFIQKVGTMALERRL